MPRFRRLRHLFATLHEAELPGSASLLLLGVTFHIQGVTFHIQMKDEVTALLMFNQWVTATTPPQFSYRGIAATAIGFVPFHAATYTRLLLVAATFHLAGHFSFWREHLSY